jgi:hypothetical protein
MRVATVFRSASCADLARILEFSHSQSARTSSPRVEEIANDPATQPAVSGIVAANCAVVVLCVLGAATGTDRQIDPAVGESSVVMFEE